MEASPAARPTDNKRQGLTPHHCERANLDAITDLVFHEQVALAYRLGPTSVVVSLIPIVFLWWVVRPLYPGSRTDGWLAASILFVIVRMVIAAFYKRRSPAEVRARFWGLSFSICISLNGLLWGYAGLFLFPDGHPYLQALVLLTLVGIAAGTLPFVMPHRWTYASNIIPMVLPLAVYMIHLGSFEQTLIGVLLVCFIGFMLFSSVGINRSMTENLRSRFAQASMSEEIAETNRLLQKEIAV
jgi:hypothetical protein